MKKLLVLLAAMAMSMNVFAANSSETLPPLIGPELVCAGALVKAYKHEITTMEGSDKVKHCSMSCIVGSRCGTTGIAIIGVAKEVVDLFTDGNSELADIRANMIGLAYSSSAYDDQDCKDYCLGQFPGK